MKMEHAKSWEGSGIGKGMSPQSLPQFEGHSLECNNPSEGVSPQIRGGFWEQTFPSLKHKRLLQLTNKSSEEVHSHIQRKTFECFMMVLKESNNNVLSTGHINQLLFVCCFGTTIA